MRFRTKQASQLTGRPHVILRGGWSRRRAFRTHNLPPIFNWLLIDSGWRARLNAVS